MNKAIFSLVLVLALTGCSKPSNFAECIIQDMEDVQNPHVFSAIYTSCTTGFPTLYRDIEQGSGQGMFAYKDRGECVVDNAKGTTYQRGSASISIACGCLYDEPSYKGQTCQQHLLR